MTNAVLSLAVESSPLMAAEARLDNFITTAGRTEAAVDRMGSSASRAVTRVAGAGIQISQALGVAATNAENLSKRIENALNVRSSFGDRSKDIAAYGQELDRLRGKFNPVFSVLQNYKTALGEIRQAQRLGAISADEMAAAIGRERQAALSSIAALKGRQQAGGGGGGRSGGSGGNGQFSTGNIAAQLFDTLSTAPYMGAGQVGLQQGPQFAQAFAGQSTKQALAGLAAGFSAILSPVSLIAIGLTTAAAAAVSFGVSAFNGANKAQEALENHEATLKRIRELYDSGVESRGSGFGQYTQAQISFLTNRDKFLLNNSMTSQLKGIGGNLGVSTGGGADADGLAAAILSGGQTGDAGYKLALKGLEAQYGATAGAVLKFADAAKTGKADVLGFNEEIIKIANQDPANEKLQKTVRSLLEMTKGASDAAAALRETGDELEKISRSRSQWDSQSANNASKYQADNDYARLSMTRRFDADVAGIGARSPREIADAERRRLQAEPIDPKESPENRDLRISQQTEIAYRRANQSIIEGQKERQRNLDKLLADQQVEIDLVGKTGGAAAALRKEYELTSALRLEAARQGIDVDQRELDLIKERAAELGRLADAYNQARFGFEMSQQASDARLSSRDRQVTTTLRQYNLPEDLNGANAQRINQQLNWQEAKDAAKGFGAAFSAELINGSHNIGKALLKGLQTSLENQASKMWEKLFDSLGNIFADFITGMSGGSAGGAGGIGSSIASAIGGAANNNTAKVIPVTRSALADIPTTDIAAYITKAAAARGIDPSIALKVAQSEGGLKSWNMQSTFMKNGVQEPSFGPYQLYMGGGLGNAFQKKTGLDPRLAANGPAGVDFALDNAKQSGWGAWYGAKKVGIGNWDGIGKGGANGAADAVNKLAESASAATTGLDTLGGGLGKLGQSLSTSFFPAAPSAGGGGGGGLFSWLGGLFGGGGKPSKSGVPMYANGTNYAAGGLSIVGEKGIELVDLPQGSQVHSNNKTKQMLGMMANGNEPSGPSQLNVSIIGASGDNHIRMLVQQGVSEALAADKDQQRRGGFGAMQARYTSQKG
ncbi:hypothetical protein RMR10_004685 [Agrobacterium rosae]|uniref:hypothetical protein n=1 Tax=Agrobacterium rosae TaxID=1972867 RepID=UPI002A14C790|nr:hypothetical protein [Agrobacterium rosae]MDX8315581.1 hypothetical protein [Agrobacterium rosae]